ncbi:MAG: S1C family serine protease [Halobacteriaceae archaeon]
MTDHRLTRRRLLGALGTATAATAGCSESLGVDREPTSDPPTGPTDTTTPAATRSDDVVSPQGSVYTDVFRETVDALVLIRTFTEDGVGGQGSGWIWDGRHIVTNHHVVADAVTVEVRFSSGAWRNATVRGSDVYSDLAVLTVDDIPPSAESLDLIDGRATIGRRVAAMGNPFGLEETISSGIVSGVNRSIVRSGVSIPHGVQTDAAINPGNSGGPLVTLDGRVVGVISAGGGENIGFAVSAPLTRRVVPSLIQTGDYDHPFMGVRIRTVSPTIAEANDLPEANGVLVLDVLEDGPTAGVLQPSTREVVVNGVSVPAGGDVIVGLDGQPIRSQQDLVTYLTLQKSPGETIRIQIIREGEQRTVRAVLGSRPEPGAER